MSVPLRERWFEDYATGEVFEFGDRLITAEEIVEFARRYDPQPFHTDPAAAARSHFGGLVASGWMTASVAMSLEKRAGLHGTHELEACASSDRESQCPVVFLVLRIGLETGVGRGRTEPPYFETRRWGRARRRELRCLEVKTSQR
jgi:hypothetical protein